MLIKSGLRLTPKRRKQIKLSIDDLFEKVGLKYKCPHCNRLYKKLGIKYHVWKHTEEGKKFNSFAEYNKSRQK